ncbi:MAG: 2'-hydroxyisoflavone reductase [Planctomycetota bacterium]|jgi:2'-hydroxyisoflavone reductase
MTSTRREFVRDSIFTSALAMGTLASSAPTETEMPKKKLRVLLLGGTGFLGPALIDAVLANGHELTLFNSGTTEARREKGGRDSVIPEGVEVLIGNRDPLLTADDRRLRGDPDVELKRDPNSPRGLSSLAGRSWDVAIDTSGYFPRMVDASASFLAPRVGQYIFISTISVYTDNSMPGMDESAEVHTLTDPTTEEFGASFENYGAGKADCEKAAEAAMPGRVTNIRPGYIVGRLDTSRRYAYWPWRVAQGGEMLVPGTADDPVQIIDVRDLAEWTVHCAEMGTVGVFNATGPVPAMTMGTMLDGCKAELGGEASFVYADPTFLAEQEMNHPIWASPEGESAGFHSVSVKKAVDAGLKFRTQGDTARSTLDWLQSLPDDLQARFVPGNLKEKEPEALKLWAER